MRSVRARAPKKVVVDFPDLLSPVTEAPLAEPATRLRKKIHRQLAEGYTANANVAREIAEEFAPLD